jgi:multiple sugar transport system substrate-binding protein
VVDGMVPTRGNRRLRRRRTYAAGAALVMSAGLLTACAKGASANTMTWYINPDNGAQAHLAQKCSAASNGRYTISISTLPNDADAQREQLVRRLAAKDTSIDIMSLDPPFTSEFANAGYLRSFSASEAPDFSNGVLPAPVATAMWKGQLVAAPFWANTQLLWYRKSAVAAMGIDPNSPSFTWDQMIDAASKAKKTVEVQGNRYEGYAVWINALILSAGGQVLANNDKGKDATVTLNSPAAAQAATIIHKLATSPAADPAIDTAKEEQGRAGFQQATGAFMVNWPYVWAAFDTAIKAGTIPADFKNDVGWAPYPQVSAGASAKPPLGGINLGISAFTKHPDFAVEAVRCLTSTESQKANMLESGNPVARGDVYDDPQIQAKFPMAALIKTSIGNGGLRAVTPYYGDVSTGMQRDWHPPAGVDPKTTPEKSASLIQNVLQNKKLL